MRPRVSNRSAPHYFTVGGLCWELLTWDRTVLLEKSGGPSVEKSGESDVENWSLQGCSPRLCRLRTDELTPANKYWTYWSHTRYMWPSKPSSFVTTWSNHIPPTPRLAHGTKNEVAQIDGWAGRSRGTKTSSGDVGTHFDLIGTYKGLPCTGTACRETYEWHTWTAHGSVHGVLIRFSPAGCTSI
jgi:hypothetical protein